MELTINSLVIELTRRCNMNCPHCLRGDTQNINQTVENISALFSKVSYIDTLTLTGGEPSLVPQIIEKIIECAQIYNVEIGNFYIATNGKKIMPRFVKAVRKLYSYCSQNEISRVEISNDEYHENREQTNGMQQLLELDYVGMKWDSNVSYYKYSMRNGVFHYTPTQIISEGRANEMGIGYGNINDDDLRIEEYDDSLVIRENEIYLNCKGWIIDGCNYSYDTQDDPDFEKRICHVRDFSEQVIRDYVGKRETVSV